MSVNQLLPFSLTRKANGFVFVSGQVPVDHNKQVPEGITAQTELVLSRIQSILQEHDLTMNHIVSATAYLTDSADFPAFNAAYASYFPDLLPTRTTVCSGLMASGIKVEITVIAAA